MPEEIAVINADGTGRTQLFASNDVIYDLDWIDERHMLVSASGAELIGETITQRAKLYRINADDGTRQLLWSADGLIDVDLSLDAQWLLVTATYFFAGFDPIAMFMRPDGSSQRVLPDAARSGTWLSDGRLLFQDGEHLHAFHPEGVDQIVLSSPNLGGSGKTYLVGVSPAPVNPRLTYLRYDSDGLDELLIADLATGSVSIIVTSEGLQVSGWSSDSNALLYTTNNGNGLEHPQLWLYDAASGRSEVLLSDVYFLAGLAFQPEGGVTYSVHRGELQGLYSLDLVTRASQRLIDIEHLDSIQWISTDTMLARQQSCWRGCEPGQQGVLFIRGTQRELLPAISNSARGLPRTLPAAWGLLAVMYVDANGSARELERVPGSAYRHVVISPDGARVAFSRSGAVGRVPFEVDVTARTWKRLDSLPPIPPDEFAPESPPRSKRSMRIDDRTIYLTDASGLTTAVQLPANEYGGLGSPIWSQDGRWLAVTDSRAGVFVINVPAQTYTFIAQSTWCHFADRGPDFAWTGPNRLVIIANPTLC